MSTPAITSSTATNSTVAKPASLRVPTQTLGQDDFLKLLVAQMSSQDPLNPQKDTDFIAQMAQFSTLEQSKAMQTDLSALRSDQQMTRAGSLLGQTVTVLPGGTSDPVTGVVSAVKTTSAGAQIVVNNTTYGLDQVALVSAGAGNTVIPTGN